MIALVISLLALAVALGALWTAQGSYEGVKSLMDIEHERAETWKGWPIGTYFVSGDFSATKGKPRKRTKKK